MPKAQTFLLIIALSLLPSAGLAISADTPPEELREYVARNGKVSNPSSDQVYNLSLAKFFLHDYSSALTLINRAVEMKPKDPEYRLLRALIYKHTTRYPESLLDFNKAEALGLRKELLFGDRSYVKLMLKDYDGAMRDSSKCLAATPTSATAWFVQGASHFQQKKYTEAIQPLSKAIQLDPMDTVALQLRGYSYQSLGRAREAEEDFTKARSLSKK